MNLLNKIVFFEKLARKNDDINVLKTNVNNYIHFSDSDRIGISFHKNIHPGNPRGIYGIKLTPSLLDSIILNKKTPDIIDCQEYIHKKYIYIFSISGNILNLDSMDSKDILSRVKKFVRIHYKNKMKDIYYDVLRTWYYDTDDFFKEIYKLYDFIKSSGSVSNEHSFMNIIWRGIGYDALTTENGGLKDGIVNQCVVLSPSAINILHKINNPIDFNKINNSIDLEV